MGAVRAAAGSSPAADVSSSAVTACAAMLALFLACSSQPALAAPLSGASLQSDSSSPDQLVPYIVGGQQTSIEQVPWQVYVVGRHPEGGGVVDVTSCGGSILNATTILTAAHCVDHEGTTTTYPRENSRSWRELRP